MGSYDKSVHALVRRRQRLVQFERQIQDTLRCKRGNGVTGGVVLRRALSRRAALKPYQNSEGNTLTRQGTPAETIAGPEGSDPGNHNQSQLAPAPPQPGTPPPQSAHSVPTHQQTTSYGTNNTSNATNNQNFYSRGTRHDTTPASVRGPPLMVANFRSEPRNSRIAQTESAENNKSANKGSDVRSLFSNFLIQKNELLELRQKEQTYRSGGGDRNGSLSKESCDPKRGSKGTNMHDDAGNREENVNQSKETFFLVNSKEMKDTAVSSKELLGADLLLYTSFQ